MSEYDNSVNNTPVEIDDRVIRQLIFYLHSTCLLDTIRPDDLAITHETLKALAKESGIDLKNENSGKIREHIKTASKDVFEKAGIIERGKNGMYYIPENNEQLYKDTIYNIKIRLEKERALKTMLQVGTKLGSAVLKTRLKIQKSNKAIAESMVGILNSNKNTQAFAEALVASQKTAALTKAVDFMAEENVRESMNELKQAAGTENKESSVPDALKKSINLVQKAQKAISSLYKLDTEIAANDSLYGDYDFISSKQMDRLWKQNGTMASQLVDGIMKLTNLDQDIQMLEGFMDLHKELFPEMREIRYEDISNDAKSKLGDPRNCWQISLVNAGKTMVGEVLAVTRGQVVKLMEKLQSRSIRENQEQEAASHFWKNLVIKQLTRGDEWIKNRFESISKGVYQLSDIQMNIYELRIEEMSKNEIKDSKSRGKSFAEEFSKCNLWRCGISKNIPGWFPYMNVRPEDRAWTLAYLKAGMEATVEGVQWNAEKAEKAVEGVFRMYMHGETTGRDWRKDIKGLENALVQAHEFSKGQMREMRSRADLPPLSERTSFNHELNNGKIKDPGPKYFKADKESYLAANIDEIKKNHQYLVMKGSGSVSVMEFPSSKEDLEKLDPDIRANLEHAGVTGILGDDGYCCAMKQNLSPTDHTNNDPAAKNMTISSCRDTAVDLAAQELLKSVSFPSFNEAYDVCQKMLSKGYNASIDGDNIIFGDPDRTPGHAFSTKLEKSVFEYKAHQYATEIKKEVLGNLIEQRDLNECILNAHEIDHRIQNQPMYRFAAAKMFPEQNATNSMLSHLKEFESIKTEDVLDKETRDRKFARMEILFRTDSRDAIQIEQQVFTQKMDELKSLAKTDPALAWCKIVAPDCERTDNGLVAHTPSGAEIFIGNDGNFHLCEQTTESRETMTQLLSALSAMDAADTAPSRENTAEMTLESNSVKDMER